MRKITPVVLGLFLAFLARTESPAQKIRMAGGVTVVSNGKKPVAVNGQPLRIKLTEELSCGGSSNPDESLSQVSMFVVDGEGGVFALDFKEQKIKVYDKTGKFLRLIGKPGQGPGELGMASGIQLMADGTLVFEVKKFDSNLKPLFTLDKTEFTVPIPGSGAKMNILDMISGYQIDPAGNIYYGRNVDYEIKVYSPEGKHFRTIQKEYDRVKVTQADIDEMLERMPSTVPGANIKDMISFPEYFPPYQSFLLDDRGRLYVRTFTKGKAKREYEIDVFDPEGRFIAQFITESDLRLWKAGEAYGIEETDEGYQVIKRYSVLTE